MKTIYEKVTGCQLQKKIDRECNFMKDFTPLPKFNQNSMENVSSNLSFFYQSKEFKRSSRQLLKCRP